jgi:chaperonin GroES
MPVLYHDDIELLSAEEVERIHRATDEFEVQRNFVIVPLNCAPEGKVIVLPDGGILIRAPAGYAFEPWIEELRTRLAESDLSRTPRRSEEDPKKHLTGTHGPRLFGTRGYLERQPDLNGVDHRFQPMSDNDGDASMDSIRPLHDRVVVERSEAEKKTAGGIVLPDNAKEKPRQGTVVAVGPGRVLENGDVRALDVRKDDRVLFEGFAGSEVKVDGKEYLILTEKDILAVIDR